jgi:hypothetical protein
MRPTMRLLMGWEEEHDKTEEAKGLRIATGASGETRRVSER